MDRKAAQKILSAYLNLLTVYPDQPYDQPEVIHPITGMPIVTPKSCGDFSRLFPKEEKVLELVRQKTANGERVLIYTSWTRTDSQQKLLKLLQENGYRTEILAPQIATEKREEWVDKRVKKRPAGPHHKSSLCGDRSRPQCLHHHHLLLDGLQPLYTAAGVAPVVAYQSDGAKGGGVYALLCGHPAGQGDEADGL